MGEVKELGVPIMRYPGGNFVSGYDWLHGVGPKHQRPTVLERAWNSIETNQFGTNEFIEWCRLVDTEPLLACNLGTGTPEQAAAYAEYWTGKVYLMMKDYSRAFRQCEKLIATYPENIWANYAYYSSGTGHFQLKDYERALGAFQLVGTAGSERMRVVELGRPLRVRVADADLLARAGSEKLTVTVAATSGDREELAMEAAESRGVYIGRLSVTR